MNEPLQSNQHQLSRAMSDLLGVADVEAEQTRDNLWLTARSSAVFVAVVCKPDGAIGVTVAPASTARTLDGFGSEADAWFSCSESAIAYLREHVPKVARMAATSRRSRRSAQRTDVA